MATHPNRSRTPNSTLPALLPRRVMEAYARIAVIEYGQPLSAAHPAEHVAAWRRTVQAAFDAPHTVRGEPLSAGALRFLLEVYRELVAITPAFTSCAVLEANLGRLQGVPAYPSAAVDHWITLRLDLTAGWLLENEATQGTTAEWAPRRDHPYGVLRLPGGAWCSIERRNPRQSAEPEYALAVLPLTDQWVWAAAHPTSST